MEPKEINSTAVTGAVEKVSTHKANSGILQLVVYYSPVDVVNPDKGAIVSVPPISQAPPFIAMPKTIKSLMNPEQSIQEKETQISKSKNPEILPRTDDTLIFAKVDEGVMQAIKWLFVGFESISGLKDAVISLIPALEKLPQQLLDEMMMADDAEVHLEEEFEEASARSMGGILLYFLMQLSYNILSPEWWRCHTKWLFVAMYFLFLSVTDFSSLISFFYVVIIRRERGLYVRELEHVAQFVWR